MRQITSVKELRMIEVSIGPNRTERVKVNWKMLKKWGIGKQQ